MSAVTAGRIERIRHCLQQAFSPQRLAVTDDSHLHVGHAGARDGRGHYTVELVSDAFAGKPALARQRAVYAALGSMMQTDIHALIIKAHAPGESVPQD